MVLIHAHLGDLDEPGREVVRGPHPSGDPAGSFEIVPALSAAIERFTRESKAAAYLLGWVKSADEILAKTVRKTQADSARDIGVG